MVPNGFDFESDEDDHNYQNLKFKPSPTDLNLIQAFNEISETEQMFVEENQIIQNQQGEGKDPGKVYYKGGEQSERTPPKSAVKLLPKDELI